VADLPPCPDVPTLRDLLLGRPADDQAEAVEQHVLDCARCVETLRSLIDDSALAQALRQGASAPELPQGAEVESLLQRLRALRDLPAANGPGEGDPRRADTEPNA
jgi:hypothetical protein